jgi:hypothetical protein
MIGSRLVSVEYRAWQLLGASLGPICTTTLRITVTLGADCVVERVDGQPLGNLATQCKEQIEDARVELEDRLRRGVTSTWRRGLSTPPAAAPIPEPSAPAEAQPEAGKARDKHTTSSVFRCERQVITDRITRLRQDLTTPLPGPALPTPEEVAEAERRAEQQRERERLAQIRARYWAAHREQQNDNLLPSPAQTGGEELAEPRKHTSSVFRVDREGITDRIERLRRKPDAPPGSAPGADAGLEPKP